MTVENMDVGTTEMPDKAVAGQGVSASELERIIRNHVWASMGIGLIPFPLVDFAGLTAVQLNLLRKLAFAYEIPFAKDKVRSILSSLMGGALPPAVSGPLAGSLSKMLPFMGTAIGAATMPAVSGATTYAVGKIFVQHFASGGTFLTFDPEKVKAHYEEMLQQGEDMIKNGGAGTEALAEEGKTPSDVTPAEKAKVAEKAKPATSDQTDPDEKAATAPKTAKPREASEDKPSETSPSGNGKASRADKEKNDKKKKPGAGLGLKKSDSLSEDKKDEDKAKDEDSGTSKSGSGRKWGRNKDKNKKS